MKKRKGSKPEEWLAFHLKVLTPALTVEREFRFHPVRRWRSDFCIKDRMQPEKATLLVEVEGVNYAAIRAGGHPGAHRSVEGMERDAIKYAEAMLLGYQVLRVVPKMVKEGTAIQYIQKYFGIPVL